MKNCLKMEKKKKSPFLPLQMKYYIKLQFKHIFHFSCLVSWAEALHWQSQWCVCCLCFMVPCDLVSSLLQPVGRSQPEDAQHHKDAPDYVLILSLVILRMCNRFVCAGLLLNRVGVSGTKSLPPLLLSALCSFWSFCLGTELGKWCSRGRSVREHWDKVAMLSTMGPKRVHPWGAMGNSQCHCKATAIILDRLWQSGEVPHHWQRTTSQPCSKTGRRRNQGSTSWSVPGKITEQTLLEVIFSGEKVTGNSPCAFAKNKCCLSNLIAFFDEVTVSVDEGGAVGIPSL